MFVFASVNSIYKLRIPTSMTNPFFDETLQFDLLPDYKNYSLQMSNLEVGAMGVQMSFLIVDQFRRTITLYSHNPELSDLFGEMGVKPLDPEFIKRMFSSNNDDTFNIQVIETVNNILKYDILGNNNRTYCLSFTLRVTLANNAVQLLKFKVIPYKHTSTSEKGIPWLVYYDIRKADVKKPGCFKLTGIDNSEEYPVFITDNIGDQPKYEILSKTDIDILQLSSDGFTETEIAEQININATSFKQLKTSLLLRLNAKSISHAITKAKKQGFI